MWVIPTMVISTGSLGTPPLASNLVTLPMFPRPWTTTLTLAPSPKRLVLQSIFVSVKRDSLLWQHCRRTCSRHSGTFPVNCYIHYRRTHRHSNGYSGLCQWSQLYFCRNFRRSFGTLYACGAYWIWHTSISSREEEGTAAYSTTNVVAMVYSAEAVKGTPQPEEECIPKSRSFCSGQNQEWATFYFRAETVTARRTYLPLDEARNYSLGQTRWNRIPFFTGSISSMSNYYSHTCESFGSLSCCFRNDDDKIAFVAVESTCGGTQLPFDALDNFRTEVQVRRFTGFPTQVPAGPPTMEPGMSTEPPTESPITSSGAIASARSMIHLLAKILTAIVAMQI